MVNVINELTGKSGSKLASFHVIEVNHTIDIACGGKLTIPRVSQRMHQLLLVKGQIAIVFPQGEGGAPVTIATLRDAEGI